MAHKEDGANTPKGFCARHVLAHNDAYSWSQGLGRVVLRMSGTTTMVLMLHVHIKSLHEAHTPT